MISLVFPETKQTVRHEIIEGEPWFHAGDVCKILNLQNPAQTLEPIEEPSKRKLDMAYSSGLDPWFIDEEGLYTIAWRCRDAIKPGTVAYQFRKWVISVIKAIRRTGSYTATESDQKYFQPFGITLQQKLEECDRAIQTTDVTSNKMRNILANKKALESARRAEMRVSLESPDAESEWSISILDFAEQRESVSVGEVIEGALKVPVERRLQMQVAALLKGKGWKKRRVFAGSKGKSNQRWFNPNEPLPQAT
jgi:prophage antirepressor-like protein